MMKTKEIVIILTEIILAGVLAIILKDLDIRIIIEELKNSILTISIIILGLAGVGWLIYKRINELNEELIKHEKELREIRKDLNIERRLSRLEAKRGV